MGWAGGGRSLSQDLLAVDVVGEQHGLPPRQLRDRAESRHPDGAPVKIATFNVNSVNARLPVLLRWLAESQPDVACLQELKAPPEKFPHASLREAGYHAIWQGQKAWNGVAILARSGEPLETGRGLAGDPDDVHSRYLEGMVGGV